MPQPATVLSRGARDPCPCALRLLAGLLVVLMATAGCGGGASRPRITITVPEQLTTVGAGGSLTLRAIVSGSSDTSVLWSVVESGGGSVTTQGVYGAPLTLGRYSVRATAHADGITSAKIPITVTAPTNNMVIATVPNAGKHAVAVNSSANRAYGTMLSPQTAVVNTLASTVATRFSAGPTGQSAGVAVNPVTNRVYVANMSVPGRVWVLNGQTNTLVTTVIVPDSPYHLAANPLTNRIYVTHQGAQTGLTVIDGATNATTHILDALHTSGVAVNGSTNRVYVVDTTGQLAVIDGATNSVIASVPVGIGPREVAVNPLTNRIYVANQGSGSVTVVDGATNGVVATIALPGASPFGIAVDAASNQVWVSTYQQQMAYRLSGTSHQVTQVRVAPPGFAVLGVAVDEATHRVYFTDPGSGAVYVVDGN